jgi:two-component sensor histidine kinase
MTSGILRNSIFGGLAFRVLLFLSLTLLPIGLVAVLQTQKIAEQSMRTAELSLIAVTDQAAATERTLLQEALGAGRALASIVPLVQDDPVQCSAFLNSYKISLTKYRLVGFIRSDGKMQCSSTFEEHDLSGSDVVQRALARGQRTVSALDRGEVTKEPVVVVTVPVVEGDQAIGFVFISIDRASLEESERDPEAASPLMLTTFNTDGEIISARQADDSADRELPATYALRQLTGSTRQVFTAQNKDGVERVYAVVPLVPGTVFVMSVWPVDTPLLESEITGRASSLLPIAMWLASLIVAFWALNRLAITHIRKLGQQMRHFALNRTLPRKSLGDNVPVEIVAMEESFLRMANSILQDEARLEDSLREKNILLKEVHHRVKNNLQLISSIMNMQIRQAPTEANKRVLQRLQDRILSLATVHKSLYQDNEMARVDAGILLREIVSRNLAVGMAPKAGIDVTEEYDNMLIGPDDAAPLSLLVSEAVTNALKYVPQNRAGGASISVSLKYTEPEKALLRVVNTTGGVTEDVGTGLGSRLIQAFARQLNGTLEIADTDDTYTLELAFPVPLTDKVAYDF